MPRFLKRIFPEHLFRKEAGGSAHVNHDHLQRSRRVLVRPSSTNPALYENAASNWRLGVFYEADAGVNNAEERRALRDGASLAESSEHQNYYQQQQEQTEKEEMVGRKAERVRRRLSKRHRMPG